MRFIGTGIDIVEVARIKKTYKRYQDGFAKKILHEQELQELENATNPIAFLAKRFAVKEAFVKAMGTGIRGEVNWHSMYVLHDENGKPSLAFSDDFGVKINANNLEVHISISDEEHYTVAQAIIIEP